MADYGWKKPETIRAEPQDYKFVYNLQWNRTMLSGSFALGGNIPPENRPKLIEYYSHIRQIESALYLYIRDKKVYLEKKHEISGRTIGQIKNEIMTILKNPISLNGDSFQIQFYNLLCEWQDLLLPYMRDARIVPLEESDFDWPEPDWGKT